MSVELPVTIAAEQAVVRQNAAMSMLKQSADAEKKVAEILDQTLTTVQASNSRGSQVDFRV